MSSLKEANAWKDLDKAILDMRKALAERGLAFIFKWEMKAIKPPKKLPSPSSDKVRG